MALVNLNSSELPIVLPRKEKKEMMSVHVDEKGCTWVKINSSSLSILQECGRKAKYSLIDGWTNQTESPATIFGSAIHKALEVYYTGTIDERRLPKLEDLQLIGHGHEPKNNGLIERAVKAFTEVAKPLVELPESDKRSIQNGVWILHEYFKTYIEDPYIAYADKDGPFLERKFTYRFYSSSMLVIDLFGTIDFIFKNIKTGELLPGDHKTTSALNFNGASYFDREKPNHQYSAYSLATKMVFGLPIENFMVNVIEVKAKPKTPKAKGISFPRQITKRTQDDYNELYDTILWEVKNHLRMRDEGIFPQGGVEACNRYSGCTYKVVCAAPNSMRENLLRNKFNNGVD